MNIQEILQEAIRREAADIFIVAGLPVTLKCQGHQVRLEGDRLLPEGIDVLVPMPITRRRQWQRGYNQSMEIARGVSSVTGIPISRKAVRRIHFTQSQTEQHAWERLHNVENAFLLSKPDDIQGKHILLIDDIVTTGATTIACGRELAKAPDVRISILALGHTKS